MKLSASDRAELRAALRRSSFGQLRDGELTIRKKLAEWRKVERAAPGGDGAEIVSAIRDLEEVLALTLAEISAR